MALRRRWTRKLLCCVRTGGSLRDASVGQYCQFMLASICTSPQTFKMWCDAIFWMYIYRLSAFLNLEPFCPKEFFLFFFFFFLFFEQTSQHDERWNSSCRGYFSPLHLLSWFIHASTIPFYPQCLIQLLIWLPLRGFKNHIATVNVRKSSL